MRWRPSQTAVNRSSLDHRTARARRSRSRSNGGRAGGPRLLSAHQHAARLVPFRASPMQRSCLALVLVAWGGDKVASQCAHWGHRTPECTEPCTHAHGCYDYACVSVRVHLCIIFPKRIAVEEQLASQPACG